MKIRNISILVIAFLIGTLTLSAQKIKIKKNILYLDNVETFIKVLDDSPVYTFIDISNNSTFAIVEFKFEKIDEKHKNEWLALSNSNYDVANEVDFEYLSLTLSTKKAVVEFLMKKLQFFNRKGEIDYSAIKEYFSKKREREIVIAARKKEAEIKKRDTRIARNREKRIIAEKNRLEYLNRKFNDRFLESENHYRQKGYAINKNGKKVEGIISFYFDGKVPVIDHETQMLSENSGYCFTFFIKETPSSQGYPSYNWENKYSKIVIKNNIHNKEYEYRAVSSGNLVNKRKRFYRFIKKVNDFDIYRDYNKSYIIKHKDKKRGVYFNINLLKGVDFSKIEKYLQDECSFEKIKDNTDYLALQLTFKNDKIEHIEKLISIYNSCKEK